MGVGRGIRDENLPPMGGKAEDELAGKSELGLLKEGRNNRMSQCHSNPALQAGAPYAVCPHPAGPSCPSPRWEALNALKADCLQVIMSLGGNTFKTCMHLRNATTWRVRRAWDRSLADDSSHRAKGNKTLLDHDEQTMKSRKVAVIDNKSNARGRPNKEIS